MSDPAAVPVVVLDQGGQDGDPARPGVLADGEPQPYVPPFAGAHGEAAEPLAAVEDADVLPARGVVQADRGPAPPVVEVEAQLRGGQGTVLVDEEDHRVDAVAGDPAGVVDPDREAARPVARAQRRGPVPQSPGERQPGRVGLDAERDGRARRVGAGAAGAWAAPVGAWGTRRGRRRW
ncbi:hypothetical protein SJI45_20395 [Streptomyces sp. S399]|uniref:hypothetical protein n=1 Tax=Streptomyces sp. S399 TaxID=3096009 RepID=UPI002A83A002|nr:hypothetical protein [Streptomyces sp. S399]WPR53065.1 hypothetical protein SJI45_20395 [Streptomyces sp. S399]